MFRQLNKKQNVTFLILVNIFTLNETLYNVFDHSKLEKNFDMEFWMIYKYNVVVKKFNPKTSCNCSNIVKKQNWLLATIFIIGVFLLI